MSLSDLRTADAIALDLLVSDAQVQNDFFMALSEYEEADQDYVSWARLVGADARLDSSHDQFALLHHAYAAVWKAFGTPEFTRRMLIGHQQARLAREEGRPWTPRTTRSFRSTTSSGSSGTRRSGGGSSASA